MVVMMSDIDRPDNRNVILDSIAEGVFTIDGNWRISSFNRAAERITGVPAAEAIGERCSDVFRASICENACALKETLQSGRPTVNKAIYIIDARGNRIPVSISTAVLKDAQGNVLGGVETFRDLSTVEELRKELNDKYTFADIIGRSHAMRELFGVLPQIADSDSTVLIEGASGTGKELFARAIHNLSPRQDKRFVAVNCGALPDTLLESELFGYKAGAFTDARVDKPGRFAIADGGTIFLDEIGDISPAMQARLLRVLQERVFEPLGAVQPVEANVRVIAATNRNLSLLVQKGAFREDLLYRIDVVRLELPLLRDRREDIPLLIEHFVRKFNRRQNKDISAVSDRAMAILMEHDYPGNVRELQHSIERAVIMCEGSSLGPDDFILSSSVKSSGGLELESYNLEDIEKTIIEKVLKTNQGNVTQAATQLGLTRTSLYRRMEKHGL